jgi:hypothetical protein
MISSRGGIIMISKLLVTVCGALVAAVAAGQEDQPTLRLQQADATFGGDFQRVLSVRELSDRRILVADGGEGIIAVAEPGGGASRTVARRGQGPNEFVGLKGFLSLRGDTTIMPESNRGRWLVLQRDSIVASWFEFAGSADTAVVRAARSFSHGVSGADSNLKVLGRSLPTTNSSYGDSVLLVTIARGSGEQDTIGALRPAPGVRIVRTGNDPNDLTGYAVREPWAAGETAAMCWDGWVAIVRIEPYRVDWLSPLGSWTKGAPISYPKVRVTDREKQAYLRRYPGPPSDMAATGGSVQAGFPEEIPPVRGTPPICTLDGRVL